MTDQETKPASKKRFRMTLFLWCAALFLAVLGGYEWWLSRQPVFEGELVGDLVYGSCKPGNDFDMETITVIGTPAIPYLVAQIKTGGPLWYRLWVKTYEHLPDIISARFTNPAYTYRYTPREKAIMCLETFGPKAKTAVPEIIKLLGETNREMLELTTQALVKIGPDAQIALPQLRQIMTNGSLSLENQMVVAGALWELGRETNLVLRVCETAMTQTTNHPVASREAFSTTEKIGQAALPMLKQLLSNSTGADKVEIACNVWKIDRDTNLVLQIFESAIDQRSDFSALSGLSLLGPAAVPEIPMLLRLMANTNLDEGIRLHVASLLGEMGSNDDAVIRVLKSGMNATNIYFGAACAKSLWQLDKQNTELVVTWAIETIARNNHPPPTDKIEFLRFFGVMSNEFGLVKTSLPVLQKLTNSDEPVIRATAGDALTNIQFEYGREMKLETLK